MSTAHVGTMNEGTCTGVLVAALIGAPAEAAHALARRISFGFAAELGLLLEQATQIDPQARLSMTDMARELRACTAEPPEVSRPALRARAAALTAAARQDVSDARARRDSLEAAWGELEQVVTDAGSELAGLLTFDLRGSESGYRAAAMLGRPPFSPHDGRDRLPAAAARPAAASCRGDRRRGDAGHACRRSCRHCRDPRSPPAL